MTIKPAIFLLSSERSGTNLLRQRLTAAIPELCNVPPIHLLRTLGYWEPLMGPSSNDANWEQMVNYTLRCCYERAVPWEITLDTAEVLAAYQARYGDTRTLTRLMDVLYTLYAQKHDCTTYFCKDIWLFDFAETICRELPNSSLIHLYRDPRDYVASQLKRPFGNQSVLINANIWKNECGANLRAVSHPAIAPRSVSISYEEFIQNEDEVVGKIADLTNLTISNTVNTQPLEHSAYDFHEWKNIHKSTDSGNFGKYRVNLSQREIRLVEQACWNLMHHLGYVTENQNRPKATLFDRFGYPIVAKVKTYLRKIIYSFRLRNEPINRQATKKLVQELTARYR